jgi:hypothetical protein
MIKQLIEEGKFYAVRMMNGELRLQGHARRNLMDDIERGLTRAFKFNSEFKYFELEYTTEDKFTIEITLTLND